MKTLWLTKGDVKMACRCYKKRSNHIVIINYILHLRDLHIMLVSITFNANIGIKISIIWV